MAQTAPLPVQPVWQQWYPVAPAPVPQRRVGAFGLAAASTGITALVVSFTTLTWFRDGSVYVGRDRSGSFDVVHGALARVGLLSGFRVEGQPIATAYFGWLGWALLLVAGVLAIAANLPTAAATALRVMGAVVATGAVALTAAAIDLISVQPGTPGRYDPPYTEFFGKTGAGFWTALAGFVLLALAAIVGPRRRV